MRNFLLIGILTVGSSLATVARAAEEPKTSPDSRIEVPNRYLSVLAGETLLTSGDKEFALGGRIGAGFFRSDEGLFCIGVSLISTGKTGTTSLGFGSESLTMWATELTMRGAFGTHLYLGTRVGIGVTSISAGVPGFLETSGSGTSFAIGPLIGYELMLSGGTSFNADLSWFHVGGGTRDISSVGTQAYGTSSGFLIAGGFSLLW